MKTIHTLIEESKKVFDERMSSFIAPTNCNCCKQIGNGHNYAHLYSGEIKLFIRQEIILAVQESFDAVKVKNLVYIDDKPFWNKNHQIEAFNEGHNAAVSEQQRKMDEFMK